MAQMIEAKKDAAVRQPPPLRFSRVFHARRETVFKAWSSTDHVKRWFSPESFTVSDANVHMHIGGPFDVCMRSPAGEEHWTRGTFVEVTPHTRLVIDMHVTDSAGGPLFRAYTEVDFADALGGTRMDVVQTYTFMDPSIAAPMVAGAPNRCSTSGTATVPCSSWKFSMIESSERAVAPVPLRVWAKCSLPSRRNRMFSRRAW